MEKPNENHEVVLFPGYSGIKDVPIHSSLDKFPDIQTVNLFVVKSHEMLADALPSDEWPYKDILQYIFD